MSFISQRALLKTITPAVQIKRYRGKINIQRPKPPHFERARYLALTKPFFLKPNKDKSILELCDENVQKSKAETDNPFQRIIARELLNWMRNSRLVCFFHMNPMNAEQQYKAYVLFQKQTMHYKNYGKKTLEMAVAGTPYEAILDFYCSHNMIVFSPEPEIKKMLAIAKKFPQLVLLAGIYDGKFLSKDELLHYQQIPNLLAAQAGLVQTLNGIGGQVVSQLNAHQNTLVGQLQERMKQLEMEEKP